ncbi:MAG: transketolase [Clostridia bacterium]
MNIANKAISYARTLAVESISRAKSGHTGISSGAGTILFSLFADHLLFDNEDANFINRDRFVLSAGHASALLYSIQHMFGLGISEEDLKNFRKLGSITPGHPECAETPFVEVSTGPLGQGVANAVGFAIAEAFVEKKFNAQKFAITNHKTYCFVGDGCLMEGVANEAISLAGTLKLNKLILLYDANNATIDGSLSISNTENTAKKFKAQGWDVIKVKNGNKYSSVTHAISKATKNKKPTLIIFKTQIGFGTLQAGNSSIHGKPLGALELEQFKLGQKTQGSFFVPQDVKTFCNRANRRNKILKTKWAHNFVLYEKTHPELFRQYKSFWENKKIDYEKIATAMQSEMLSGRHANKQIIDVIADKYPRFIGGTADVCASTLSYISKGGDFSAENRTGKNIYYGIREHAMGAISNGLALYLNSPVFCSTFLSFSNYMIPSIRMSALMRLPVQYYFTHDSFRTGEDGPTHQPVEQLGQLRCIPNLSVFRPADSTELVACHKMALATKGPSAFVLSKNTLLGVNGVFDKMLKGGYVLNTDEKPEVVIYASGSEVDVALQTKAKLARLGIQSSVCSFPSLTVFDEQSIAYKNSVLQKNTKLQVVIEASNDSIWYKYVTQNSLMLNFTSFGKSGKADDLEKYFNYNSTSFAKKIKFVLDKIN